MPPSGTDGWRSRAWCCWPPAFPLSSSPITTRWGGPLGAIGAIGAIGMIALALWAILPRWQSVVPRPLRGSITMLKDAPVIRQVRSVFGGYDRWRQLHRLTGLFVAAGFVHGLLDGSPFPKSTVLRWSYVVIGGVGLVFYVYRELFARFFSSLHDYEVDTIGPAGPGLVEISLRPLGRAMTFVPGQFALVYIEAKDGWHRHPFTIASAPASRPVTCARWGLRRPAPHGRRDVDAVRRGHLPCGGDAARSSRPTLA